MDPFFPYVVCTTEFTSWHTCAPHFFLGAHVISFSCEATLAGTSIERLCYSPPLTVAWPHTSTSCNREYGC